MIGTCAVIAVRNRDKWARHPRPRVCEWLLATWRERAGVRAITFGVRIPAAPSSFQDLPKRSTPKLKPAIGISELDVGRDWRMKTAIALTPALSRFVFTQD